MDNMTARINSVKNYLKAQYMLAEEEWISGCVEFLLIDSSNNYTEREIQNVAKEQWLLNDLKAICPGSLPANLKNQQKTVLNGNYVLQINSAIDVGTSAYQQYLKLEKVNMENVEATTNFEDRVANHRMIKLKLTDGVQEVTGIEYRPMRNLDCNIIPGCKMLLKGPVECRRGTLLLTESSIELLGGEVEDMVLTNSLPMLLASMLKLSLPESSPAIDNIPNQRISRIPTPHTEMPPRAEMDYPISTNEHPTRPVARVTSIQVANFNDDDIDFDQLAAIEAEICDTNSKNNSTTNIKTSSATNIKTSSATNEKNYVNSNKILPNVASNSNQMRNDTHQSCKRQSDSEIDTVPDKKVKTHNHSDYTDDIDMFCEDEDYLREIEQNIDKKEGRITYPLNISQEPYTYIKHINKMTDIEKAGKKFKIKAQILKLISKLVVSKEGWSLKCILIDGTGSLEVEFTSDVLSKLVGITPNEMNRMKKEMVHNPELKERVVTALYKAKESLQILYCIIEITMMETPKITQLIPFQHSHEMQHKKRLENTGLEL